MNNQTVCTSELISFSFLPYNFKSSIKSKWFILPYWVGSLLLIRSVYCWEVTLQLQITKGIRNPPGIFLSQWKLHQDPHHMLLVVFSRTPCFPSLAFWCYLQPLQDQVFPISSNREQNHTPSYNRSKQLLRLFSSACNHEVSLYPITSWSFVPLLSFRQLFCSSGNKELWWRCLYKFSAMIPVSTFHITGKHVIGL